MNYCEIPDCENVATVKHNGLWFCDDCYDLLDRFFGIDEYGYEETDFLEDDDFDEIS
jgi:hypothetical protein